MHKLEGKDLFSVVVVICATVLIAAGKDTVIGYTLLAVVAGYYGIDLSPWIKLGRNQHKPKPSNPRSKRRTKGDGR